MEDYKDNATNNGESLGLIQIKSESDLVTQQNQIFSSLESNPQKTKSKLALVIKSFNAKTILKLKSMSNPCNSIDNLATCILLLFDKPIPKSFPWESVIEFFVNPGIVISEIRRIPEKIENKQINLKNFQMIFEFFPKIQQNDIEIHRFNKEIQLFYDLIAESCEICLEKWPEVLEKEKTPKRKFKIPQSAKKIEENLMQQQINKEKKMLRELQYQERLMKWDEERSIKKEMKQEQLRELQREINYNKSIEDEYRKNLEQKKKQERVTRGRNFSCKRF